MKYIQLDWTKPKTKRLSWRGNDWIKSDYTINPYWLKKTAFPIWKKLYAVAKINNANLVVDPPRAPFEGGTTEKG